MLQRVWCDFACGRFDCFGGWLGVRGVVRTCLGWIRYLELVGWGSTWEFWMFGFTGRCAQAAGRTSKVACGRWG